MDFEIEDDPNDFQFQNKWSKPGKSSGFFSGGNKNIGEDVYDYDFGGGMAMGGGDYEISHYSTPPSNDKGMKNKIQHKGNDTEKISSGGGKGTSQMSAMEKAQSMLNKYSKKGSTTTTANKKPHTFTSGNNYISSDYNEDDISIGSDELSTSGVLESPPPKSTKPQLTKDSLKNKQSKEPVKQQLSRGYDLENDDDDDELSVSGEMEPGKLNSMTSVYDLGMQPPSNKSLPPTRSIDDDDYSKDRFDDGSVSFDDYGKGGIYQEGSVLSDSAVIADEKDSGGKNSPDDDDIDDYQSSRPKVFEFSDIGDILAPEAEVELDVDQPAAYSVPEIEESHADSVEESNVYGNSFESEVDPFTPKKDVKTAAVKTFNYPAKVLDPPSVTATEKAATKIQPVTQNSSGYVSSQNSNTEAAQERIILPKKEHNPIRPEPQHVKSNVANHDPVVPPPVQAQTQPPVQPVPPQEKLMIDPNLFAQSSNPTSQSSHQQGYPSYPSASPHPPLPPYPQYSNPLPSQPYHQPSQQYPQPTPPSPAYPYHQPYPAYSQYPQPPHVPQSPQWPSQSMYPPYYPPPPPPFQYYPPQPQFPYSANPFLQNPYQSLLNNPLQPSPFSAQQSLAQLLQRSGLAPPPPPPEDSGPTMAEILRELQAAKEEAAFATKKLADVILEVHRSKTASPKSPPSKSKKSPERARKPSIHESVEQEEEDEEDDEEYYDDEFEEESNINISRISTSPQPRAKPSKQQTAKRNNKSQPPPKAVETEEQFSESNDRPLHPPEITERDSMELNWSRPPLSHRDTRRYPRESSTSLRESYDTIPISHPARETFDTLLSTSQSLYRRQLLSLREKLDSMNQSMTIGGNETPQTSYVTRSQPSLSRTYQRGSRYPPSINTVRSSIEPIPDTRTKLREALLQVSPTSSTSELYIGGSNIK